MSTASATNKGAATEQKFDWPLCYEAENFLLERIDAFLQNNTFARVLSDRMREETGTLFLDWVDHLHLPKADEKVLRDLGFTDDPLGENQAGQKALWHPQAMLPRVLLAATNAKYPPVLAIRPEYLEEFVAMHGVTNEIEGEPFSRYRRVVVYKEDGAQLDAIERRGYRGYIAQPADLKKWVAARELWRTRRRMWDDDAKGYEHAFERLRKMIDLVGRDMACHLVFCSERAYWQKRNRAGIEQKRRQDLLGLGWANHDHHTFRVSRKHFVDLMKTWEMLGFQRRERYYAGRQAGWGAQIVEQPIEGIVIFNDVDLLPEETEIDFSRNRLPPEEDKLGTIGLWVGLHGESFLEAGMHHLECRFDFALLRDQLAQAHITTMKPFSDFPFLKQAFTKGERWKVRRERAERLKQQGLITEAQFDDFMKNGAIGSHLENLQRKGGFKGFNQKSVSVIIAETDPRKQNAIHQAA